MAKKVNYGRTLKKVMKKKGVTKIHVTKLLKITRPTLNTRLGDGNFAEWQLDVLRREGLLPIAEVVKN